VRRNNTWDAFSNLCAFAQGWSAAREPWGLSGLSPGCRYIHLPVVTGPETFGGRSGRAPRRIIIYARQDLNGGLINDAARISCARRGIASATGPVFRPNYHRSVSEGRLETRRPRSRCLEDFIPDRRAIMFAASRVSRRATRWGKRSGNNALYITFIPPTCWPRLSLERGPHDGSPNFTRYLCASPTSAR